MSIPDSPTSSSAGLDHFRCDFGVKKVCCERCGREFVVTPWDDFYCTDADHCCKACLLVGRPGPLILLDPDCDVSRLRRIGSSDASSRGVA